MMENILSWIRVYSGENKEEETYDEIEVEWYEGDDSITEEEQEIIIERFWDMDYDEELN